MQLQKGRQNDRRGRCRRWDYLSGQAGLSLWRSVLVLYGRDGGAVDMAARDGMERMGIWAVLGEFLIIWSGRDHRIIIINLMMSNRAPPATAR